jgi:CHAT domain-containing protein
MKHPALVLVLATSLAAIALRAKGPAPRMEGRPDVQQLIGAGQYQEAEPLARSRVVEAEAESGAASLAAALALDDLAEVFWRLSRGTEQEPRDIAARAVRIKEELFGADDPRVAVSLRNLAMLLNQNGDSKEARRILERSIRISETAFGPESGETAAGLDALATALRYAGDFAGARPLVERALAIRRRVLGHEADQTVASAMNLASTIGMMGDYEGARNILEEQLVIIQKHHPPEHPLLLQNLASLGELMTEQGEYDAARPIEERVLALREKKLGPNHFHVAVSLTYLGELELKAGHREAAVGYLRRAVHVCETAFGPDHPLVAWALVMLGEGLLQANDADGARVALERALRIQDKTLDPLHPERTRAMWRLAQALFRLGRSSDAFDRSLDATRLAREHFQAAARSLDESDALQYAEEWVDVPAVALKILGSNDPPIPHAAARAWDEVMRGRALVLDEMASRNRDLARHADMKTVRAVQALVAARRRLAELLERPPQPGQAEEDRKQINQAHLDKGAAERALAEVSATFRRHQTRSQAGLEMVLRNLPRQAALVAFVRFEAELDPAYGFFLFHAGLKEPIWTLLGPAAEIDGLVEAWQREAGSDPRAGGDAAGAMDRYRVAGERLRRRIWDPVASRLGPSSLVLVVPDGALNLVSLATLPMEGTRFLIEQPQVIHYLSSERDLVPVSPAPRTKPGLLAIGAVDYDAAPPAAGVVPSSSAIASAAGAVTPSRYRGPESVCSEFNTLHFTPLPATASELHAVAATAGRESTAPDPGTRLLSGSAADEATFKEMAERFGILHFATHAFIANSRCDPSEPAAKPSRSGSQEAPTPRLRALQDPLLLSGLALAGANRHGGPDQSAAGEDGLLTSEEIASLDLSGVRWAVLSACRTGVGEVRNGEGVLGLRRAFDIAGAGTLIMSLWQVEDEATSAWMKALYEARTGSSAAAESVRAASLKLLAAQRASGGSPHPYYWGGFIAAGDWR